MLSRLLLGLPIAILSPAIVVVTALVFSLGDLLIRLLPRKKLPSNEAPGTKAASIVIPNWNGRDLLEKYLPSVATAASRLPGSEVIVVDNGSTDGSADFIRQHFPSVNLIALTENLGFGGGSNTGIRAAKNDIAVLLNSDMRVEENFLAPLLAGFTDAAVFSVSCQIFFSDPAKPREETGLTEARFERGAVRVGHRNDPSVNRLFPCFYGGGGSCAYDKRKFFELGGFDELLKPFYLEDTDLGYLAWKRGWKNLYQPASVVYHEHRGTIGKTFSPSYINGVLKKNYLLFTWKNIQEWRLLVPHFFYAWSGAILSWIAGDSPQRASLNGLLRAFLQLPHAMRSRWRAYRLAAVSDQEAFCRHRGAYFRDRFGNLASPDDELNVLFAAPYPLLPPVHGGAVFMNQTARQLARYGSLHALVMLDWQHQLPAHEELSRWCASVDLIVRERATRFHRSILAPFAVREFALAEFEWAFHRQVFLQNIDIVQLEYTMLGQYAGYYGEPRFERIPIFLFEHDVYFQSVASRLAAIKGAYARIAGFWEYLRALYFELHILERVDRIQVCTTDGAAYLTSYAAGLASKIDARYRAGIDVSHYPFQGDQESREPNTILFLGSFRHAPNQEALTWFTSSIFPLIRASVPEARLLVVGSDPPPAHTFPKIEGVEWVGFVDDIRQPLARYAVFVCPILSGSGIRVKLLEAFALGVPVVSTRLGAEGLARNDGEICALADDPAQFANRTVELLRDRKQATELAARARKEIETHRDIRAMTLHLVQCYRQELARKNRSTPETISTGS